MRRIFFPPNYYCYVQCKVRWEIYFLYLFLSKARLFDFKLSDKYHFRNFSKTVRFFLSAIKSFRLIVHIDYLYWIFFTKQTQQFQVRWPNFSTVFVATNYLLLHGFGCVVTYHLRMTHNSRLAGWVSQTRGEIFHQVWKCLKFFNKFLKSHLITHKHGNFFHNKALLRKQSTPVILWAVARRESRLPNRKLIRGPAQGAPAGQYRRKRGKEYEWCKTPGRPLALQRDLLPKSPKPNQASSIWGGRTNRGRLIKPEREVLEIRVFLHKVCI